MSFKAKKTALCVGLCFLGMISAQQASAATESVASVQQSRQAFHTYAMGSCRALRPDSPYF